MVAKRCKSSQCSNTGLGILQTGARQETKDFFIWKQAKDNAEQIWNFSGKMFKKPKLVFLDSSITQTFGRKIGRAHV